MKTILASVRKLAQMDPQDAAVDATVEELRANVSLISEKAGDSEDGHAKDSMKDDVSFINDQISKLHAAASAPARNYQRVLAIVAGLARAAKAAEQPRNAAVRPRIAGLVAKVAGVFAQIDMVEDLDKPLEAIEKAVHSLYGDQSKNSTFYLGRRGKGHQGE